MPTIRLQNGKVLTKVIDGERRVTCSCCFLPGCCAYPATQLGGSYTADDMLDVLRVNWIGHYVGSVSKSGSSYSGGSVTLAVVNGAWTLTDSSTTPATVRTVGNCLLQGGSFLPYDTVIEDQFSDCYEVSWTDDTDGNGPGTATVIRQDVCYWESLDQQWYLLFGPYEPFGAVNLWEIGNTTEGATLKETSTASPEGVYGDMGYYLGTSVAATTCP